MMRIQRDMSQDLLLKSAAQVSARIPNDLSEAKNGNNVSYRCAQQHPWEAKSGVNVS